MTPPDPTFAAPARLEVAPGVFVREADLRFGFARSSGPGGQNVNKLNTKAELWVPLAALAGLSIPALARLRTLAGKRLTAAGELHLSADTSRSQERNRQAVLDRLRLLLIEALRQPTPRRKTRPTRASQRRRLDTKRRRAEVKARRQSHGE